MFKGIVEYGDINPLKGPLYVHDVAENMRTEAIYVTKPSAVSLTSLAVDSSETVSTQTLASIDDTDAGASVKTGLSHANIGIYNSSQGNKLAALAIRKPDCNDCMDYEKEFLNWVHRKEHMAAVSQ